jgi:hypothetical protein
MSFETAEIPSLHAVTALIALLCLMGAVLRNRHRTIDRRVQIRIRSTPMTRLPRENHPTGSCIDPFEPERRPAADDRTVVSSEAPPGARPHARRARIVAHRRF